MSVHVVIQPSGSTEAARHYRDTIENPVSLSRIRSFLSEPQVQALPATVLARESIPVWGVRPGKNEVNVSKWNKLQVGDVVVFSGQSRIFSSGVVVHKVRNKALGTDLWPPADFQEAPFEYLYFLDEIFPRNIPYVEFNAAAGYQSNNNLQGFVVINEEISANILFAFDLYSDTYYPPIAEADFTKTVRAFDPSKPLDAKTESYSRTEQGYLRRKLFGDDAEANCCICGKSYPVGFLVAAHIKKRSKCSTEERLDVDHIVAPMCKFGCDDLYEKGFIGVADNGSVVSLKAPLKNITVQSHIDALSKKSCSHWNTYSAKYFEWHRSQFIEKSRS